MIRAMLVTQHKASFFVELQTDSQPDFIEVEYDASTDDNVDVRTFRPSFTYEGGWSRFTAFVLTNKPWKIRTHDDSTNVDTVTKAYNFFIEIGEDEGGMYADAGFYMIVDKLRITVFEPMGELIENGSLSLDYAIRAQSMPGSTRVRLRGLPGLLTGQYVVFEVSGIESVMETSSQRPGNGFGIWRNES